MKKIVSVICIIIIGSVSLFLLDVLIKRPSHEKVNTPVAKETKDLYNDYGLKDDMTLSTEIICETEDFICFKDRCIKKFIIDNINSERINKISESFVERFNNNVELLVCPIPGRYVVEKELESNRNDYEKYFSDILSRTNDKYKIVNLLDTIDKYKDEYIYFRTDDNLTALGGLYCANQFISSDNKNVLTRKEFDEYQYQTNHGNLYYKIEKNESVKEYKSLIEGIPSEPTYSYFYNGIQLNETLYFSDGNNYDRPAILKSSVGTDAIVGSGYKYSVIHGMGYTYDESIAIICDNKRVSMAPYLAYYYKNVCVINVDDKFDLNTEFEELIKNYNIKRVIWAQDAEEMSARGNTKVLNCFEE